MLSQYSSYATNGRTPLRTWQRIYWVMVILTLIMLLSVMILNLCLQNNTREVIIATVEGVVGTFILFFGVHSMVFRKNTRLIAAIALHAIFGCVFIYFAAYLQIYNISKQYKADHNEEANGAKSMRPAHTLAWWAFYHISAILNMLISGFFLLMALLTYKVRKVVIARREKSARDLKAASQGGNKYKDFLYESLIDSQAGDETMKDELAYYYAHGGDHDGKEETQPLTGVKSEP
mmetsp:Transcript_43927/g.50548  ORF Transcript_43927/g.50548 Transcript_43927/m.50548 type:complete len:234 (+) Transcript_43927:91-792(+)